jgi:hypothetical protein
MQILSKQRPDEIMSVFKFFGFIANDRRFPPPNQQTREDSYSFSLYSTFSGTSRTHAGIVASFRFFSKRFSPILILLLRGTSKNEGIPEVTAGNVALLGERARLNRFQKEEFMGSSNIRQA